MLKPRCVPTTRKGPNGVMMYDFTRLEPELAESWALASDGMSVTFKLRRDARFHDGTPVRAQDVKWSFDRMVTVGGFPTFQMKAGSIEKPEQFVVIDDHTFRVGEGFVGATFDSLLDGQSLSQHLQRLIGFPRL